MMTSIRFLMEILTLIGILIKTTIMEQKQELSTISPALKAKTKEELLAIIARKDAVESNLRKEILRLKEIAKTAECTNVLSNLLPQRNSVGIKTSFVERVKTLFLQFPIYVISKNRLPNNERYINYLKNNIFKSNTMK